MSHIRQDKDSSVSAGLVKQQVYGWVKLFIQLCSFMDKTEWNM
jgi:hypothetical protein